jgi:hypothetical protein
VVLKVNPFDEPNVTESKNITSRLLEDVKKKKALPRPGKREKDREVPEQDLKQRRNIAEDLDIDGGQLADQPVG